MVTRWACPWITAIVVGGGCASTAPADLSSIADQAPLPYSVLVTGGGFVQRASATSDDPGDALAQTFDTPAGEEPVGVQELVAALRAGRVFTRSVGDTSSDLVLRLRLARMRSGLSLEDAEVLALLEEARAAGHDFVVVVQRLVDAPVEEYGINNRWPLTVSLWFLVGLGMFIPDHTFESQATLHVGVFEAHTGRLVHRTVGGAGPTELSLVSRGNVWSLIQSILIPPFWVANHDPSVLVEVRTATERRLVAALARALKGAACRQDLEERSRAVIELVGGPGDRVVRIRANQAVGSVALRVDGMTAEGEAFERFVDELTRSTTEGDDGRLLLEAGLPALPSGRYLQILVRTVAGDVASITVDLEDA